MGKTYNRIMQDKRPVGFVVTRCGPPALEKNYPVVEAILEKCRPATCISRSESVNMREDRDFSRMGIDAFDQGYVHVVEPVGAVEARDVEWIGALQARWPKGRATLPNKYPELTDDQLADRYWSGQLSAESWVEHASKAAVVVSAEAEFSPVRPPDRSWRGAMQKVAEYGKETPDE